MDTSHFIRVGALGQIGRYVSADAVRYPRHSRVIVRSQRGLEIGEVLSDADPANSVEDLDGTILRGMTDQDHLLEQRLEKNRREAYTACVALFEERGLPAVLVDVEHLFDASRLYFHFLGDVTPEVEAATAQLAETYEAKVQIRQFAQALADGCGPDCGTENGGGCDSCSGCTVAEACSVASR